MKIVLDTNVLISGIFWKGIPHTILRLWQTDRFAIIASESVFREYIAVLYRIDTEGGAAARWSTLLFERLILVEDSLELKFSRDVSDDKFITAAISGGADYIVSGDSDLLSLEENQSLVPIVSPKKFVTILQRN